MHTLPMVGFHCVWVAQLFVSPDDNVKDMVMDNLLEDCIVLGPFLLQPMSDWAVQTILVDPEFSQSIPAASDD